MGRGTTSTRRENVASLRHEMAAKGAVLFLLVTWAAWYRELTLDRVDVYLLIVASAAAALALAVTAPAGASWAGRAQVFIAFAAVTIAYAGLGYVAAVPFYIVPVLMAGFYLGPLAAPLAAAAAAAAVALTGKVADPLTLYTLLALVAGLMTLISSDTHTALWQAWGDAERAATLTREVRLRQAEVNRLNKALHVSNGLLKRSLRELAQAQKEAAEARHLKEQFATTVSHELRTPLNIILGFLEVMQRYPEVYGQVNWTPSLRRDVDEVQSSAQYLSELVDDIIDLARVEALRRPIRREQTFLSTLVDEAVHLAQRLLMEKPGVGLRLEVPDTLPTLFIDRTRMRQVLLNLLANACRFTDAGEIAVRATLGADEVVVAVSDTGPGIPEDKLDTVFEEFLQSGSPGLEAQHRAGKGLGLAIAKRFVQLHGGRIWAESRTNGGGDGAGAVSGTTFYFTLPLAPKQLVRLGEPPQVHIAGSGEAPTVVLVGDSEAYAFASRRIEGYHFVQAGDMVEARKLVREIHPDGVLVNVPPEAEDATIGPAPVHLPEPLPVVHCSLPAGVWLADASHFDDWLVKPVDSDRLLQALSRFPDAHRLLVVDDDRSFVRMMRRMLSAAADRYEIAWAHDGEEALARILEGGVEGVLLDIGLPGADGWAVARTIRERSQARIPIIAITATEPGSERAARVVRTFAVTNYGGLSESDTLGLLEACLSRLKPDYGADEPGAGPPGSPPEIPAW
ncbi:MAG: ATP-binding response regulator [Anaerolineae bacterium]